MNGLPAVRERTEELERASLSTWATLSAETKGRDRYEEPDAVLTAFQRDRDRLLGSRSFARLGAKTHVFVVVEQRRRSRGVHTAQLTQVARTLAGALRLNEDLTEAIAVGADLGATPFGHAGRQALEDVLGRRFSHPEQSLREVESLEGGGTGLNLTWEVRDGILGHDSASPAAATAEGQTVRVADLVVTATGVLRDAIAAGLLDAGDVPGEIRAVLGDTPQMAVATLVDDVVATSTDRPEAALSPTAAAALAALRQFVDEAVLERDPVRGERDRALYCVASLAVHLLEEHADAADPATTVTDAISALTDDGVLSEFGRRFLPGS